MTREETLIVMGTLKAAYPQYYRDMSRADAEAAVALWAEMFAEDDAAMVVEAVKSFLASDAKGYPPHIGVIKEQLHKLREIATGEQMTEMEAWRLVSKAIARGYYYAQAEFDKLPPIIQRVVRNPDMLRNWAVLDSDEVETVVASNFMRSYKERRGKQREQDKLPPSTKAMLQQLTKKLAMPALEEAK